MAYVLRYTNCICLLPGGTLHGFNLSIRRVYYENISVQEDLYSLCYCYKTKHLPHKPFNVIQHTCFEYSALNVLLILHEVHLLMVFISIVY